MFCKVLMWKKVGEKILTGFGGGALINYLNRNFVEMKFSFLDS